MARTAEMKLRIDPELKAEAAKLYQQWGLNLTDAVTIFLNQSVAYGGLPFDMRQPKSPVRLQGQGQLGSMSLINGAKQD